jgi:hypothetical protein
MLAAAPRMASIAASLAKRRIRSSVSKRLLCSVNCTHDSHTTAKRPTNSRTPSRSRSVRKDEAISATHRT